MATRFRAILARIKQEPGWLLLLIGALTLYVTWRLYKSYAGGGSSGGSSGASVPTNGIDTPLYPSTVGGTPGNPSGGVTTTGPGGMGTDYAQQLQDLLTSLVGPAVTPSFPSVDVGSPAPSTPSPSATPIPARYLAAARTVATAVANAVKPKTTTPAPATTTHPAPTVVSPPVGQNVASALTHVSPPVGQNVASALTHVTYPTSSAASAASASAVTRHTFNQPGY